MRRKLPELTVSRVTGHGRQVEEELYRGQTFAPNLISKVRLDIACNDEFVKITRDAIMRAAKHGDGKIGDGKIFITHLEECIRVRTSERGGEGRQISCPLVVTQLG